jgi:hypothetical protein
MPARKVNPLLRLADLTKDELEAGRLLARTFDEIGGSLSPSDPCWIRVDGERRGRQGESAILAAFIAWARAGSRKPMSSAIEVAVLWVGTRTIDARDGLKRGTTKKMIKQELARFAGLVKGIREKNS